MTRQTRKVKTWIGDVVSDTITNSSDSGFAENLYNLHSLIETIRAEDGIQIRVQSMVFDFRVHGSVEPFYTQPVVVQTAGAFAATVNLAGDTINEILNAAVDDVFGYQLIGPHKVARRMRHPTDAVYGFEIQIPIPQNILAMLNKETETERLQSAIFALIGKTFSTAESVYVKTYVTIKYTEERKTLTIR